MPRSGSEPGEDTERGSPGDRSPSELIDERVTQFDDWRGATLSRLRTLIKQADPEVVEEWKWQKPTNPGVPVWSHDGIICTGETYKSVVKLTFAKGASLPDPSGLFNSSLGGSTRRAIDVHEGEEVDAEAFKELVGEAVALNKATSGKPGQSSSRRTRAGSAVRMPGGRSR